MVGGGGVGTVPPPRFKAPTVQLPLVGRAVRVRVWPAVVSKQRFAMSALRLQNEVRFTPVFMTGLLAEGTPVLLINKEENDEKYCVGD